MKTIKRIIAISVCFVMIYSLAACGDDTKKKEKESVKNTVTERNDEATYESGLGNETSTMEETTTEELTTQENSTDEGTSTEETSSKEVDTHKQTTTQKQTIAEKETTTKQQTTTKQPTTTQKQTVKEETTKKEEPTTKKSIDVESISFEKADVIMNKGEKMQLNVKITPNNATVDELIWETNNSSVVKVNSYGQIEAVGSGTATIYVTSMYPGYPYAACNVTVNVSYPSVDKLSEIEKELLPYYNYGWTWVKNRSNIDIYYLGEKIHSISNKIDWYGDKYEIIQNSITITDDHKIYMVALSPDYYADRYVFIYDIDTDQYTMIDGGFRYDYVATYGDYLRLLTDGQDVYMLLEGTYKKMNVLKYSDSSNRFEYVNSFEITLTALLEENFVYYKDEKVWKTEAYSYFSEKRDYVHALVTLDLNNGTISIDENNPGEGIAAGTKFSMYLREKGINYYWKEVAVTNEYTDNTTYHMELRMLDKNTSTEKTLYSVNRGYEGDLEFIGPEWFVVTYDGYDLTGRVYYEKYCLNVWCEDIIGYVYEDAYDMWNYYYDGKAYSIMGYLE